MSDDYTLSKGYQKRQRRLMNTKDTKKDRNTAVEERRLWRKELRGKDNPLQILRKLRKGESAEDEN